MKLLLFNRNIRSLRKNMGLDFEFFDTRTRKIIDEYLKGRV